MFNKILVPIDGSRCALAAAHVAGEIAQRFDSQITMVHVVEPPTSVIAAASMAGVAAANGATDEALGPIADEVLAAARQSLALPAERVTQQVVLGHPAEMICQVAAEGGHDLIVMGSRGISEVRAFFMGSVSDKVSHHAPCPVLIVR
jgi:nucleotide-binding universal stress UspA family protein